MNVHLGVKTPGNRSMVKLGRGGYPENRMEHGRGHQTSRSLATSKDAGESDSLSLLGNGMDLKGGRRMWHVMDW